MAKMQIDDNLLVAYADGELDAASARHVESLIAVDQDARERVQMFRQSTILLRAAFAETDQHELPPKLLNTVHTILNDRPRRPLMRLSLMAAAVIAAFAIGIFTGPKYFNLAAGDEAVAAVKRTMDEVAEYHGVFARETEHLVEVPAAQKQHIEAWLGERVKFAFSVPDLGSKNLKFEGGRMLVVDGLPIAQLMYTNRGGERIALCVGLSKIATNTSLQRLQENGWLVFGQSTGGHQFVVVGPSGESALESLAEDMPKLFGHS